MAEEWCQRNGFLGILLPQKFTLLRFLSMQRTFSLCNFQSLPEEPLHSLRARDTIDRFFREHMSPAQKSRVEVACYDMRPTYLGANWEHLPRHQTVLDRSHVIKALNKAVDEVRCLLNAERKLEFLRRYGMLPTS